MPGLIRLLAALALGLACAAAPAAAQDIHINPVPPQVKPQWTPVANASGVFWAPNLPTDVFRHGGKYYFYWEGYLYRGSKPRGPWKSVTQPPAWFSQIDPQYFKTIKRQPAAPPAGPPAAPPMEPPAPPEGLTPPAGPPEGLPPPVPPEAAPPPPPPPEPTPEPIPEPSPGPEKAPGAPVVPPEAPAPKVM